LLTKQRSSWNHYVIFTRRRQFPALNKAGKKFIQEVCGVFLYLARAVNGGLLPALSSHTSQKANPTEKTMELCKQFLDYMATQEEAIFTYHTSVMVPAIHSNVSYLSEPKSCSRMGGHMFKAGKDDIPFNNGSILNTLQNNPSIHVIHSKGRIGCPIHQCKNWHLDVLNAHGTWPHTTMHANANQQRNSTRTTHQQNITKSTQGHGYVLKLAKML
jgi:hypothetical protein